MVRPRWHDAVIVLVIAAVFCTGVWSLWWDDVRSILHLAPAANPDSPSGAPAPVSPSVQT